MKTITLIKNLTHSFSAQLFLHSYLTSFIFALITLSSCSDDNDERLSADADKVIGTYTVVDTYGDDQIKNYDITISKAKDGGVEISNFGKIMYVPVKASIKGNVLTIPAQTFKGNKMTIVISGLGTLNENTLDFEYTIQTGGDLLQHTCVASRNVNNN